MEQVDLNDYEDLVDDHPANHQTRIEEDYRTNHHGSVTS